MSTAVRSDDVVRLDVAPQTITEADPTRSVRRRATTILGAAAAPLLVLSNVLLPGLPAKAVDVVAQAPPIVDRMLTAHLVYTVASLLFIPFTLTLWRVKGRRGSTLRLVGGVLTTVGMGSNTLTPASAVSSSWLRRRFATT